MAPTCPGTSISPMTETWPATSSGSLPCTVMPRGRVCGIGHGMADRPMARRTSNISTSRSTAAMNRIHW